MPSQFKTVQYLLMNHMSLKSFIVSAFGFLLLIGAGGCESAFSKQWSAVMEQPVEDFSGCWTGIWSNETKGWEGSLRCIITNTGESEYTADLEAKWLAVFSLHYAVDFQAVNHGGLWHFSGESDLGFFSDGLHTFSGKASNEKIYTTCQCAGGRGTIELHRP